MANKKNGFDLHNSISFGKATRFPKQKASNSINTFLLLPSTLKERKCNFGYGKREIFSKFLLKNALINPAPNSYFQEEDENLTPYPFLSISERNNTDINEIDTNSIIYKNSEEREKSGLPEIINEEIKVKSFKKTNAKSIKFINDQNSEINETSNNIYPQKKNAKKMVSLLKNAILNSSHPNDKSSVEEENSINNQKKVNLIKNEYSMSNHGEYSITNLQKKRREYMKNSNCSKNTKKSGHNLSPNLNQNYKHSPGKSFGLSYVYYKKNYIPFDSHPNIYLHDYFPGPGKYNDSLSNSKKILMKIKTESKNFIDWEILNYKSPKRFYDCNETKLFGSKRYCNISFGKGKKMDFTVTPCREFPGPADYDPGKFKVNDSPINKRKKDMKLKTDHLNFIDSKIINDKSPILICNQEIKTQH